MGRFDGILICTDLDGTLLKNDKSISEENRVEIACRRQNRGDRKGQHHVFLEIFLIKHDSAHVSRLGSDKTAVLNLPVACFG